MLNKFQQRKVKDVVLGLLLGLIIFVPMFFSFGLFDPNPYSRVDRLELSVDKENENLNITYKANFYKYANCTFIRYAVYGFDLGEWKLIQSSDPTGEKGDRVAGWQTIELTLQGRPQYSKYEIRLEHDCGESYPKVGTVFDRFDYKDIQ